MGKVQIRRHRAQPPAHFGRRLRIHRTIAGRTGHAQVVRFQQESAHQLRNTELAADIVIGRNSCVYLEHGVSGECVRGQQAADRVTTPASWREHRSVVCLKRLRQ